MGDRTVLADAKDFKQFEVADPAHQALAGKGYSHTTGDFRSTLGSCGSTFAPT